MRCPKCTRDMKANTFAGITIERCTGCAGMWFDALELNDLQAQEGAEVIDGGDVERGRRMDAVGKIKCPLHEVPMIRMVDRRQPHIWYEQCPTCHGIYLDAGEFKDLLDHGLSDLVKHWRKGERPLP